MFLLSIIFLSIGIKGITGNIIKEYFQGDFLSLHIIGLVFLLVSFLILSSRKTLDAIIVSTGDEKSDIERPKKASKQKAKYYVISGEIDKTRPIKEQQTATIYRELRKQGIKPSQVKIEGKSGDTLENALYSLKKLKGMKNIGIVSYPQHLKRFKYIINKAQEENLIPNNLNITYIPTKETSKDKIYGFLGLLKEKYRLRHGIEEAKKHKTGWVGNSLKKVLEIFD